MNDIGNPDDPLQVEVARRNGVATVRLLGELDFGTGPGASAAIEHLLAEGGAESIMIDLSGLSFCDAAGMNVFVNAQNLAAASGTTIVLANPTPPVRRVFDIVELNRAVNIEVASRGDGAPGGAGSEMSESE